MTVAAEGWNRVFTSPPVHTSRPTLTGSFGMSASTHWVATATAQSVLERGGNAFDAATAAGFVLHVVEPHLNGPGGDMVAIVAPVRQAPVVVNAQGPAPAGASVKHMRGLGLENVPGSGALAAAVPGAVEGWLDILDRHGTWALADVLEYAIHYAETGIPVGSQLANVLATIAPHFREYWPSSADLWLREGRAPEVGELLGNPEYARTLRRLLKEAKGRSRSEAISGFRFAWKSGFVAQQVCEFIARPHQHSSGSAHAGVLTVDDWARFRVSRERPLTYEVRGVTVAKPGFWSQGPVLLQALAILGRVSDESRLDPSSAEGAHTILEALKLAMADRDTFYGEGGSEVTQRALLSTEYAMSRADLIGSEASREFRPGSPRGFGGHQPPLLPPAPSTGEANGGIGEPTMASDGAVRGDTCHLDVVDRWGNLVSATPSGGWLQSSPTVPGLGVCLGTRLQMAWLDESIPSGLRPGRRPRTTLTPTVLLKKGEAVTALGTPGGDQQDQWQLLYLLRTIIGGYEPQQAIDAPAFHTTSVVSSFVPRVFTPAGAVVEARLGVNVIDALRDRGHDLSVAADWSLGRLTSVSRDLVSGTLSAAANPRGQQGYAAGR